MVKVVDDKNKMEQHQVRLPRWLWDELEKMANETLQPKSTIVRIAILQKLNEMRGERLK